MADMLSQEEIDALLNSGGDGDDDSSSDEIIELLTNDEKDALGEIGNISMGTAATTLFTLLGQKVTITTPKVRETTIQKLQDEFVDPCVTIYITYKYGIEGVNVLVLHERDVKVITDLMMGGDGTNIADELTDLHLSAIGEAMNQMIGSSSTSLSEMIGEKVDISPPEAVHNRMIDMDLGSVNLSTDDQIAHVSFRMTIGDLVDSEISQIMPIDVAKQLVKKLLNMGTSDNEVVSEPIPEPQPTPAPPAEAVVNRTETPAPQPAPAPQPVPQSAPVYQQPPPQPRPAQPPVNAQAFQYESFDTDSSIQYYQYDIGLVSDVPLEITVELGRTSKQIKDILDFAPGTVIELDKLVGEPLDILANGKKIAKGEVVVVDESYGVRLTDILVPDK